MRTLSLLALVLSLAACDSGGPADAEVSLTDEARLGVGETAVVDGVAVRFDDVVEDSRCPDTAVCVWPGWAIVALTIDGQAYDLRVVDPDEETGAGAEVGGRLVFATDLTGGPFADEEPVVAVATANAR